MNNTNEINSSEKTEPRPAMIKCLAIDDDPLFLKMLGVFFNDIKTATLIDSFTNPVEGTMAIVKQKPDVILLDIEMPYLTGLEALETLDKRPKVIVISGHSITPSELDISVDKFISKSQLQSSQMLEEAINSVI